MDCGQVGETNCEVNLFRVKWRIDNFFSLSDEFDCFYASSYFYFLNTHWFLKIFPNGVSKNPTKEWIGLFLTRSSRGPPKGVNYVFSIRTANRTDEKIFSYKCKEVFSEEEPGRGTFRFLQRSELLNRKSHLAPSDALTIVCTLWSDEPPTVEGGITLRKHFQDLLLDAKDHDVTLKVKDQEFRAHKNILRARSKVFAAMFTHNMTENESGDVCIEDCDPGAFGEFLKYVYVGKVENMSPNTSTGLYYAADKYDFPDLKETCVEFLKTSLTIDVISDVVSLAVKHGENELLECAMEFFSKHMVETLKTVKWQRFIENNPILANDLIIKAMETSQKSE